ncbi:hypothetical protein [Actinospica robiniae]|uniref:hypothetical protein n=1 Tax=Actinospica robiniae TaxID=304901 RepID=UPI0012F7A06D|nr:hypothetical protein [Actinospica robiniae]
MSSTSRATQVAVITHEHDLHAYAVRRDLARRHGIACRIVEADRLNRGTGMIWAGGGSPELDGPAGFAPAASVPDCDGESVPVADLAAVWFRRLNCPKKADYPGVTEAAHLDLIRNDSRDALLGTMQARFTGTWVDRPEASRTAENKVRQLQAAAGAGLAVPRTLVSNDPSTIRAFCAGLDGRVIIKPVRGTGMAPMITAKVTPELLANDASLRLSPAIYQELIPGSRHIRAHVFGEHDAAALLESGDLDWRPNLGIPATAHTLPAETLAAMRRLLDALELSMGVFDLKLTATGYVFLEVNPQGQFLFIEGMCGLPLTAMMADFLAEAALVRGPAAGAPRP